MAEYPCDFHLARYVGPSTRCFLNLYRDDQAVSLRASICSKCLEDVINCWLSRALVKTDAGHWDPLTEGQELEGLWRAQEWPASQRKGPGRY